MLPFGFSSRRLFDAIFLVVPLRRNFLLPRYQFSFCRKINRYITAIVIIKNETFGS